MISALGTKVEEGLKEHAANMWALQMRTAVTDEQKNKAMETLPDGSVKTATIAPYPRKNLIPYPYQNTTRTVSGVVFTDNGDGSVTANGTATARANFWLVHDTPMILSGTYKLLGCPSGGDLNAYRFGVADEKDATLYYDIGEGEEFAFENATKVHLYIQVAIGTTVNNLTFAPSLVRTDISDELVGSYGDAGAEYELGENLLEYPYYETTKTENGITWTDNGDGTVTATGTATGVTRFEFEHGRGKHDNGTYMLSGCPSGGGSNKYALYTRGNNHIDNGEGITFEYNNTIDGIAAVVYSGTTVNNLIFRPTLRKLDMSAGGSPIILKEMHGLSTQDGTPTVSNPVEIKNTAVKVETSGKNLLKYPYHNSTKTQNGITFADNKDGSVTIKGTATAKTNFWIYNLGQDFMDLSSGEYTIFDNSKNAMVFAAFYKGNTWVREVNTKADKQISFTLDTNASDYDNIAFGIAVSSGNTVDETVYPMICKAPVEDATYDPPRLSEADTSIILRAVEVTSTDSYTYVKNGKYYVADTLKFTNGKYKIIRRVGYIESYSGESITTKYMSSTGNLTTGATVQYVLTNPVEEIVSSEDAGKLLSLKSFDLVTYVENDSDVDVDTDVIYALNKGGKNAMEAIAD